MAVTYEQAVRTRDLLSEEQGDRQESLKRLREYWHGNFWDQPEAKGGFLSIFRDNPSALGPDIKLVRNFIQQICVKYQTFLSPLPMVTVPIDPPMSKRNRERAVLKERALYGLWEEGNMAHFQNKMAWYLPLMGDCYLGIWPDFDTNLVRPLIRSPEYAFPVPGFDVTNPCALDAVIFSWKAKAESVKRSFPKWNPRPKETSLIDKVRSRKGDEAEVEVLEWSDTYCFHRWIDGEQINGVQHDLGFNLFDQIQFIHVPDEVHGHGAVEQIVGMNELHNATLSLLFQSIYENVYPTMVLVDPAKAPEQIMRGPGAVIPLNAGGDVKWLHPPTQALPNHMGFLGEMERSMKEETSMPDVNFGQFRASIVTGKAINELQGAGTGTTIEMVQGTGMGTGMASWNSKALFMLKRMFGDETIKLGAPVPGGMYDLHPKMHSMSFKGSQIVGSLRNQVTFSPSLDGHTKLVMQLQALGAGLISKGYGRAQIGIPDSEAMEEEILGEMIMDGVMRGLLAQMEQGVEPEAAGELEAKGLGYLSGAGIGTGPDQGPPLPELPAQLDLAQLMGGGPPGQPSMAGQPGMPPMPPGNGGPPPTGGPPPGGGAPPGGPPGGGGLPPDLMAALGGGGGAPPGAGGGEMPPDLMAALGGGGMPTGEAPPEAGGAPPEGPPGGPEDVRVSLDQAIQWFQSLEGSNGRIFLIGEIVQMGAAEVVEVGLTDLDDRQIITDGLPQLAGRARFRRVGAEPDEPFVEVTPGREVNFGGEEPELAGEFG